MAPIESGPTTTRRPPDARAAALMTLFCLILGLQQVAIKAIAADIAPLAQIGLRSAIACALVGLLAYRRGLAPWRDRRRRPAGLLVGAGFTAEFACVALGLNYTTASHMVVFLYTAPVFAALGLHWLVPGEALTRRQGVGIVVAFSGIVLAMAPGAAGDVPSAGALVLGDGLGLLAGLSWAATTIVLRRSSLSEAPSLQTLFYQLFTAGVVLLPVAIGRGALAAITPTPTVFASMAFQTLVVSFGAFLLWVALLRRYLASRLGVFSFLSPIFGVAFGALLLGEPLSGGFIAGGAAILVGVVLVSG